MADSACEGGVQPKYWLLTGLDLVTEVVMR